MITHAQRRQLLKRSQGINLDDLHKIALREARPDSEKSGYPSACRELADRIADESRNHYYGSVANKQRDLLAQGMPRGEMTNCHGESLVERADFKLKGMI